MGPSRFLGKHPLTSFCLGPSGENILQAQPFSVEWNGEFIPKEGIYYGISSDTNQDFIPIEEYSSAKNFSFAFESGNLLWYCLSESGKIHVVRNSTTKTTYSFSGNYGQIFNNTIFVRGGNDTICTYEKNGVVFARSSDESFLNETIIHSGDEPFALINQIYKTSSPSKHRLSIFGLSRHGDGIELVLDKNAPLELEIFNNFEQYGQGPIKSLDINYIEEPTKYFISGRSYYRCDDFSLFSTTGIYSGLIR